MRKLRLLFICSGNLNRSPTFAKYFEEKHPEFEVRSTGCWYGYPDRLDEAILDWADWIFVMDISHEKHIRAKYPLCIDKMRIVGVSDQYDWNAIELRDLIDYWYREHFLELTGGGSHFPDCGGTMCLCEARLK